MDRRDFAETLGFQALGWLVGQPELLDAFLAESGLGTDELRARAAEPEFLGSVLDFLLQQDVRVVDFANHMGIPPGKVMTARAALPGGEQVNWT